ncbi:MAG: enoyl-CoA hydratase/isomerase family protein [Deltaproteobacteria bacterium]|jgi:enoyl-CoA hydratase/carnithine racemase|nr:enoyl-CoA hydratase/isomerase family protein [Deltaproteobacteria bacterium]
MRRKINLEGDYDFFSGQKIGNILLLGLKKNLMFQVTNLGAKTMFLDYLDLVSGSDSLKVVVIWGYPAKTGRNEYKEFYTQVIQSILDVNAVYKMFNAVDQCILKIIEMSQIVIHADSGNVLPLFLNISLACDYRIVADNTLFQNPCLEFGLVPKGGGAFFLSKIMGSSKAYEFLLSEEDIAAEEALRLGLVDKIVPLEELREAALTKAEEFACKPARSLKCIKRLINFSLKDLLEYLEFETDELTKMIGPFGDGLTKDIR